MPSAVQLELTKRRLYSEADLLRMDYCAQPKVPREGAASLVSADAAAVVSAPQVAAVLWKRTHASERVASPECASSDSHSDSAGPDGRQGSSAPAFSAEDEAEVSAVLQRFDGLRARLSVTRCKVCTGARCTDLAGSLTSAQVTGVALVLRFAFVLAVTAVWLPFLLAVLPIRLLHPLLR